MIDYREVVPPPTALEKRLKSFNVIVLIAMFIFAISNFAGLPDEIPTHFNAKGEANAWGSKMVLFFIPGICVFLFGMMHLISTLSPKSYNFPVKLTAENAKRQVDLARQFMQGLNALIFVMLFYILWRMVDMAKGDEGGLGTGFMVVFLGAIFGAIGYYMYLSNKAK
ncbi:MAG: DUF1648 domain-containing protein [Saprospiraceae bacterium]